MNWMTSTLIQAQEKRKRASSYNLTSWETPSFACSSNSIKESSRTDMGMVLFVSVVFCLLSNAQCIMSSDERRVRGGAVLGYFRDTRQRFLRHKASDLVAQHDDLLLHYYLIKP